MFLVFFEGEKSTLRKAREERERGWKNWSIEFIGKRIRLNCSKNYYRIELTSLINMIWYWIKSGIKIERRRKEDSK